MLLMVAFSKIAITGVAASVAALVIVKRIGKGLNIVWDLDDTLIKSEENKDWKTDESKKNTIMKIERYAFEHVDDDVMYFRTYIRPYARFVLSLFKFVGAKQYVFTSATVGYMDNICVFLDPNNNIFEERRLSTSDFEKGVLSKNGKDIKLLFDEKQDDVLENTVLVDDKIKYHTPQPQNGIYCNPFAVSREQALCPQLEKLNMFNDTELMRIAFILLRCCMVKDVRSLLGRYHPLKYMRYNPYTNTCSKFT